MLLNYVYQSRQGHNLAYLSSQMDAVLVIITCYHPMLADENDYRR